MKQPNWTQMLNRKSTNTSLLLRNFVSKNSLKTLFKVDVQAKRCVFELFLLSIWVQFVCFMMQKFQLLSQICLYYCIFFDDFIIFGILAYVWDFFGSGFDTPPRPPSFVGWRGAYQTRYRKKSLTYVESREDTVTYYEISFELLNKLLLDRFRQMNDYD